MKNVLLLFCILLVSNQLLGQVLTKSQLNLVKSKDPYEEKLLFHKIVHQDSTEIFEVQYFLTFDTVMNSDAPDSNFSYLMSHNYFTSNAIEAYYVDGIYRCYYPNDTLKVEGVLEFYGRTDREGIMYYGKRYKSAAELNLNDLGKRGFWNEYYDNGKIKLKGMYAKAFTIKGYWNQDLGECKGGFYKREDSWIEDIKFGIWKDFDRKGKLIHRWIYYYDNGKEYQLDLDK